ncbi:MAG: signal peptide peptidase SppA [Planctomycetota bacterium]|jgi:protease-4
MAMRILSAGWILFALAAHAGAQAPEVIKVAPQRQLAPGEKKVAKVAHIRFAGELSESPVANDSLFGTIHENLKIKLDRIQKASKDDDVQAIVIHFDGIEGGWAKVEEIRRVIANAKKAGKKVYAYLETGEARDYLAASDADLIAMPPSGALMIVGIRAEITFFKDLLESLGIRADFLQMGIFKAAAEPYTRSKMSEAAKSQYNLVFDDFFLNSYVGSIFRSRNKKGRIADAAAVVDIVNTAPHTARTSLSLGLIDHLAYPDEFRDIIKKDLGASELKVIQDYGKKKAEDIDFSNPFAIFKLLAPPRVSTTVGKKDKIALIYAIGAIVDGKSSRSLFDSSSVGSTTLIEAIKQAEADPKVKAIVLRVDSPGGSALASDLIWNELRLCKKPVIASMSDTAASGGFYISMGTKKVYAEPSTLTGSIGVVGGKIALKGLMEKYGVNTEVISRGANSGLLSRFDGFSPSERKAMELVMKEIYDQFLDKTIEGRRVAGKTFTREQLLKLAEGRIWSGRQAFEHGLIDALGGLDAAIADAKTMGGLAKDAEVEYLILPKPTNFLDSLLDKNLGASAKTLLQAQPELRDALRAIEPLLQNSRNQVWMIAPTATWLR